MDSDEKPPTINQGFFSKHKHALMMLFCCMLLLLLIGILWVAGVSQNILSLGIILLCPIMHLLMMKNMNHDNRKSESRSDEIKKEELS